VDLARPVLRRRRRNNIKRFEVLPELIYPLIGHMDFFSDV
jgi:hypothetical protein